MPKWPSSRLQVQLWALKALSGPFFFVNKRGRGKIAPVEHDKESIKAAIEANQSEH